MARHFLFNNVPETKDIMLKRAAALLKCEVEKLANHPDFLMIEGPEVIDDILPAIEKANRYPMLTDISVIVFENLDLLNYQAQNKLLKLLEDTDYVSVLASDGLSKPLLDTIRSRMESVDVKHHYDASTIKGASEGEKGLLLSDECLAVFDTVKKSIDENKSLKFLLKDDRTSSSFFALYGLKGVKGLYNLLSNILYAYIAKYYNVSCNTPSNLTGLYELDALDKASMALNACIGKVEAESFKYTQNNFFADIFKIDKLLGGQTYGIR